MTIREHYPKFHIIPDGEAAVIFFPDSLKFHLTTAALSPAFLLAKDGATSSRIQSECGIREAQYAEVINVIKQCALPLPDSEWDVEDFSTLILNVSNDCNMMCGYCYANHGLYRSQRGLMSSETAIKAIDRFANRFHRIREIKFFGGEPLMNPSTIEAAIVHAIALADCGILEKVPRFKVITNGTIINDTVLRLVKDYHINIVFSVDGPPEIHDYARVFRSNAPTYQLIREHFDQLKAMTGGKQPLSIEVTYSNAHYQAGLRIIDTVQYLYDSFHLVPGQVNVSLANLPSNHPLALPSGSRCWSRFAEDVVNLKRNGGRFLGDLKLMGLIHRIKHRKKGTGPLCSAGNAWSAVSASGSVYPCLMFIDEDDFLMGRVKEDFFDSDRYGEISKYFQQSGWRSNAPCRECFARNICNRCAGINRFFSFFVYGHSQEQCEEMRACVSALICGIAEGFL